MNSAKIQTYFNSSEAHKKVLKELLKYERSKRTTDVRQFHQLHLKNEATAQEVMEVFEGLDRLGLGSYIEGRGRLKPTRFIWNYRLHSVAKAGEDGVTELAQFPPKRVLNVQPNKKMDMVRRTAETLKKLQSITTAIDFQLLTELGAKYRTTSFSKEEAGRLKSVIDYYTR